MTAIERITQLANQRQLTVRNLPGMMKVLSTDYKTMVEFMDLVQDDHIARLAESSTVVLDDNAGHFYMRVWR